MINSIQFEVLAFIESNQNIKLSQRSISKELNISLGIVNKTLHIFIEEDLIENNNSKYKITDKGYKVLDPYRVKKAIFLAAGFGSRLVPITLNTPKPLILVNGKKIIETLLDAVVAAGIEEIILVRGYLSEQFDILLKKYPNIKFIENPIYNETNNISSALLIKDLVDNAYILESDLYLYNPKLIRKYEYSSNYLGRPVDYTDDWCFEMKKEYISKVKIGGRNVNHMYGISYWSKEDGEKLSKDIDSVFHSPGGKERYWDEVSLKDYKENYQIKVRECKEEDIIEIDTFNELKLIDPIYKC